MKKLVILLLLVLITNKLTLAQKPLTADYVVDSIKNEFLIEGTRFYSSEKGGIVAQFYPTWAGMKVSLYTYVEPVIVPEVPEIDNVTIPEVEIPVINDSLINESNMTGNVFSRISESLKSIFGSNEEDSEETTLFQKPIVIIPILLLIGAGIGVGAIILIKKVTAASTLAKADGSKPKKKVKKSKKNKESIEKKIDLPKKITQVLEAQFEYKKKDKLGVKKLKY